MIDVILKKMEEDDHCKDLVSGRYKLVNTPEEWKEVYILTAESMLHFVDKGDETVIESLLNDISFYNKFDRLSENLFKMKISPVNMAIENLARIYKLNKFVEIEEPIVFDDITLCPCCGSLCCGGPAIGGEEILCTYCNWSLFYPDRHDE